MDTAFNYRDYRDCFLAILEGMMAKNGLNMASEDHFRTLSVNVDELAVAAERKLAQRRLSALAGISDFDYDTGGKL